MNSRIVWPLVAALGLAGLVLVLSPSSAQRGREGERPGPAGLPGGFVGPNGRFVVAHASATQVLILDTMTGQVYRAKEEDFKKLSELSKSAPEDIRRPAEPRERGREFRPRDRTPTKERDDAPRRRPGGDEKEKEKEPQRRQ